MSYQLKATATSANFAVDLMIAEQSEALSLKLSDDTDEWKESNPLNLIEYLMIRVISNLP